MFVATCFWPDGRPVTHRNGDPLQYVAKDENRARLNGHKAWLPGSNGKLTKDYQTADPKKLIAPLGSTIRLGHAHLDRGNLVIDEEPIEKWRMERVPVFKLDVPRHEETRPVISYPPHGLVFVDERKEVVHLDPVGLVDWWVDVGQQADDAKAAAELEEMRAQIRAKRAALAAERAKAEVPAPVAEPKKKNGP